MFWFDWFTDQYELWKFSQVAVKRLLNPTQSGWSERWSLSDDTNFKRFSKANGLH
jgi:hypothetical protein